LYATKELLNKGVLSFVFCKETRKIVFIVHNFEVYNFISS